MNKITNFKTSQGSEYFIENNKTIRHKHSEGIGKGEKEQEGFSTLYVTHERADMILIEYNKKQKVRLGFQDVLDGKFSIIYDIDQLPQNSKPVILSFNEQEKLTKAFLASATPELGLHPIEMLYHEDGTKSFHVGNEITEINTIEKEYKTKAKSQDEITR